MKTKKIILFILFLFIIMIPQSLAIQECKKINPSKDIPCLITTTWQPPNDCESYSIKIFNVSGDLLTNGTNTTLGKFGMTGFCNYTFNMTDYGSYTYNLTTGDTGNIILEDETQMIVGIMILVPMLLSLVFLIGALMITSEEHQALKIFLFLLSIVPFFTAMHFGVLGLVQFYNFPALEEAVGSTVYWVAIIFGVLVAYFCLYLIYSAVNHMAEKKKSRLEY
jgi:hypothetical protein